MIVLKGTVVTVFEKKVKSKEGKEFDIKFAQIEDRTKTGKSILWDVQLSKDMNLEAGEVVELPLIIDTYTPLNSQTVYTKYKTYQL